VGTDFKSVPIVSDGANTAHIALQGQYTTAGFEGAYDQGSGTAVAYDAGGTDLKSVPILREREVDLKRRTAAEVTSAAVLLYGVPGIPQKDS